MRGSRWGHRSPLGRRWATGSPALVAAFRPVRRHSERGLSLPALTQGQRLPRPSSPDRLNPDWCRLRTGGTEIFPGQDARAWVLPPGLAGTITSWTGPS